MRAPELAPAWTGAQWASHVHDATLAGGRVRYLDIGEGPVLLLVHGLGASWQAWYANIPALAERHRVLAVDLPGFGHSEPVSAPGDMRSYADALASLLELLDVARAVVVGHSLGGLIVQRLAIRHPGRVAGIVLVATSSGSIDPRRAQTLRQVALLTSALRITSPPRRLADPLLRLLLGLAPVRQRLLRTAFHDPSAITRELAAEMLAGAYYAPGLRDGIMAGLSASDSSELHRINCPALIVAGANDRLVPPAAAERLAEGIDGARLEVYEDAGHHPMLEQPDSFDARVLRFAATCWH
jgi:pimeloyl-ACP methyl ester carboxylesterase